MELIASVTSNSWNSLPKTPFLAADAFHILNKIFGQGALIERVLIDGLLYWVETGARLSIRNASACSRKAELVSINSGIDVLEALLSNI